MTRKRTLTPEEQKLWDMVMHSAKPLLTSKIGHPERKRIALKSKDLMPMPKDPSTSLRYAQDDRIKLGAYANIDKNTATRFRKGDYPLDGTLDLHGMTREKAHRALYRFLHRHYTLGSRALLVITGKGLRQAEDGEVRGVLRESLPHWLSGDEFAPMILTFDVAQPKDGGSGAFYILLRRKR